MITIQQKNKGFELLKARKSVKEIALEVGVSETTVSKWKRELNTLLDTLKTPLFEQVEVHEGISIEGKESFNIMPKISKREDESGATGINAGGAEEASSSIVSADIANGTPSGEAVHVTDVYDSGLVDESSEGEVGSHVEKTEWEEPDKASDHVTSGSQLEDAKPQTWLLATNHLNIAYMLSAGMLMGPAGFEGKHYRDPGSNVPGWLPLFRNEVPESALTESISERKDLRHCIAEVDIQQLSGKVWLVTRDGGIQETWLPAAIDDDIMALLVPAPLPLSLLIALHFGSEDDRRQFEATVCNDPTVDLSQVRIGAFSQSLTGTGPMTWPPVGDRFVGTLLEDDRQPVWGQALGGVLAMLYHLANRSDLCNAAFRVVAGGNAKSDSVTLKLDSILSEFSHWLRYAETSSKARPEARLYWGIAKALLDTRLTNSTSNPIDSVIKYLGSQSATDIAPDRRSSLDSLIKTIKGVHGMSAGTISDLLKKYQGLLSRPLLLLCLRERCKDLLEFSHPDIKDEELVLAAILFGIREGGWRRLPMELRRPDALSRYVMHRMCDVEQKRRDNGKLSFVSIPCPTPLRELVFGDTAFSTSQEQKAFEGFARRHNWTDCIVTRIEPSWGQHCVITSDKGIVYEFRGFTEVTIKVDKDSLQKRIAQWPPLPPDVDGELRDILTHERR